MASDQRVISYVASKDVQLRLVAKAVRLQGPHPLVNDLGVLLAHPAFHQTVGEGSAPRDICLEAQLFIDGEKVGPPLGTAFSPYTQGLSDFDVWLRFPIRVCDLALTSQIGFTVWDCYGPRRKVAIGGVTLDLFGRSRQLRSGVLKLPLWKGREATPETRPVPLATGTLLQRLEAYTRLQERGEAPKSDWLDKAARAEIERLSAAAAAESTQVVLTLELPRTNYPILYQARERVAAPLHNLALASGGDLAVPAAAAGAPGGGASGPFNPGAGPTVSSGASTPASAPMPPSKDGNNAPPAPNLDISTLMYDPEIGLVSSEEKEVHHIPRGLRIGLLEQGIKPESPEAQQLSDIVTSPPTSSLPHDQHDLLWTHRQTLIHEKKALVKFLLIIRWDDPVMSKTALDLMRVWVDIDIDDALLLLSSVYGKVEVREYAVGRLERATDEEIISFLLQLVQAVRYEPDIESSKLVSFLIKRGCDNYILGNYLYWYLKVETDDVLRKAGNRSENFVKLFSKFSQCFISEDPLAEERESTDAASLSLENNGSPSSAAFAPLTLSRRTLLDRQNDLLSFFNSVHSSIKTLKSSSKQKRVERLRDLLTTREREREIGDVDVVSFPLVLPVSPSVVVSGFSPADATIFASVLKPLGVWFDTPNNSQRERERERDSIRGKDEREEVQGSGNLSITKDKDQERDLIPKDKDQERDLIPKDKDQERDPLPPKERDHHPTKYGVIYKVGDDLRQDQLVIQLISLMDRLLKQEHLDLSLSPYNVLATSSSEGLVEFVPNSSALSKVLADSKGDLLAFFQEHHPDHEAPYGVDPKVLSRFTRSCAGYCVITYILGIGDRHLDNLLITTDGRLFHVDFSFMLGRDPKPFPPPMKLCKEMVDGMGGAGSVSYNQFKALCAEAFIILRRSSNLIMTLLFLMSDAQIPDLKGDTNKMITKVKDKFKQNLSDEKAAAFIQDLISESVNMLFPLFVEKVHKWATYWRAK